jgi:hypothetical protein
MAVPTRSASDPNSSADINELQRQISNIGITYISTTSESDMFGTAPLVYNGFSTIITSGSWLVNGFATVSSTGTIDVMQTAIFNTTDNTVVPGSKSGILVPTVLGYDYPLSTQVFITCTKTLTLQIAGYTHGTQVMKFNNSGASGLSGKMRMTCLRIQ